MRITVFITLYLLSLLGLGQTFSWATEVNTQEKIWSFKVYLDDSALGTQSFMVSTKADGAEVRIQASFDYDILFVNLYRYRHSNLEVWKDGCLVSIEAATDDDGESFFVSGSKKDDTFTVSSQSGEQRIQDCVHTYSYWDSSFLKSSNLLNSQTGEYQSVRVNELGIQTIDVLGKSKAANHYLIKNNDFEIELWYAVDTSEWLALRSTTADGKVLRYQRIEER